MRGAPRRGVAPRLPSALLVALPARAALFDDDEARKRIEATNLRLDAGPEAARRPPRRARAQLKSQGLVELFSQVEQLKADVARLRGQIEVLTYEQEQPQKRQRDLYVDLDSRLRKLEGGAGASAPPASGAPRSGTPAPARRPALPPRRRAGALRPPRGAAAAAGAHRRRRTSSAPTTPRSTSSSAATIPARSRASTRS